MCLQVGTKTAETLHDQTKQLERVVDDLDQIQFSLKKARQVIRDITRGIATDKWVLGGHVCWAVLPLPAAQPRKCQAPTGRGLETTSSSTVHRVPHTMWWAL